MKTTTFFIAFLMLAFNCAHVFAQAGALDKSFGIQGKISTELGGSLDRANFAALQPDGKIILAANSNNTSSSGFALIRYNSNGSPDPTFGLNGIVEAQIGAGTGKSAAYAVAVQPDGKIVAVGSSWNGVNDDIVVARFNPDGTPDLSFNNSGVVIDDIENDWDEGKAVALQPDGKIVVAGHVHEVSKYEFTVLRYNTNGTLDPSFGKKGLVITNLGGRGDFVNSMVLQPDGKIVVAGDVAVSSFKYDFAIVRYNVDGSQDASFGENGIVHKSFGNTSYDDALSVALQPDGKIVAGGYTTNQFALVRYNPDGTPDNSFGISGSVTTSLSNASSIGHSVAIQSDGKILLAGYSQTLTNAYFEINRYDANGNLDPSFGLHGIVETSLFGQSDFGTSMVIQPDNKIIVAGYSSKKTDAKFNYDVAVARYLSGLELNRIDFSGENNSVFIYPNPVQQNETFSYILSEDENVSVNLYDVDGKIAQAFFTNEKRSAGSHEELLNFKSSLPIGNYVLVLSNGKQNINVKITKL